MDIDSNKINDEEIENLNVRCVIGALAFLQTDATESELVSCFTTTNDEPQNVVQEEIKRILDKSVNSGLIVRNADKYALPNREHGYQIDGDQDDDSDIEFVDPDVSHYEVFSSPSAREAGTAYKRVGARKRRYKKRVGEPTDRVTRSQSSAASQSRAAPPPSKRFKENPQNPQPVAAPPSKTSKRDPQPPTRFSKRTLGKRGRGRGR